MKIALHITHEAVQKIGGIGSVIAGLVTSPSYRNYYDRTILYGPLFNMEGNPSSRLGKDGIVLYSGIDNYDMEKYTHIFAPIEKKYGISIVYGKRIMANETNTGHGNEVETILIHINSMKTETADRIKFMLWESFGIQSERYGDWDYEQYVRIAVPYAEILKELTSKDDSVTHFSHEYMGMACALKITIDKNKGRFKNHRTVFYAHEVSTSRSITENLPGHDISFYGIMNATDTEKISMESVFGDRSDYYRNELVKRTVHLDKIFAVSSLIAREIKFLNPEIDDKKIAVVFNGIFHKKIDLKAKKSSRNTLKKYCKTIFNYSPDTIFTHVTRLVSSKGLWRDVMLLEELDELFETNSMTGFYILLSTLIGTGRPASDITRMEREYGWPVMHKEGWPDLVGIESEVYSDIEHFNAKSKAVKAVFINQFGFNRHSTGNRIPENAHWIDLRTGSDAEFGMSVYEPFGIAQIETVPFGSVAVLSDACGCADLIKTKFKSAPDAFHIIDFTNGLKGVSTEKLKDLDASERKEIEKEIIKNEAEHIFRKVSGAASEKTMDTHLKNAQKLSLEIDWDHIVLHNIIPVLKKIHH